MNHYRRTFINTSAMAPAAIAVLPSFMSTSKELEIGLQNIETLFNSLTQNILAK